MTAALLFVTLILAMAGLGVRLGMRTRNSSESHSGATVVSPSPANDRAAAAEALRACIEQARQEDIHSAGGVPEARATTDPLERALTLYRQTWCQSRADWDAHWDRQCANYWHYHCNDD